MSRITFLPSRQKSDLTFPTYNANHITKSQYPIGPLSQPAPDLRWPNISTCPAPARSLSCSSARSLLQPSAATAFARSAPPPLPTYAPAPHQPFTCPAPRPYRCALINSLSSHTMACPWLDQQLAPRTASPMCRSTRSLTPGSLSAAEAPLKMRFSSPPERATHHIALAPTTCHSELKCPTYSQPTAKWLSTYLLLLPSYFDVLYRLPHSTALSSND